MYLLVMLLPKNNESVIVATQHKNVMQLENHQLLSEVLCLPRSSPAAELRQGMTEIISPVTSTLQLSLMRAPHGTDIVTLPR
jgi:hypothetical protein